MSPFRNIEHRLEGLFERGFRRAFRSQLQPVELARKLAREMDNNKTVSVSRVYGPNEFHVYLSSADYAVFESYEGALVAELETYLSSHARSAGLSLVARPIVHLETDPELRGGEFGISCRMEEHVAAAEAAPQADPFEEHISEQPPAPGAASRPAAPAAPAPAAPAPAAPAPAENAALAGVSGTQVLPQAAVSAAASARQLWLEFAGERHLVADDVTSVGRSRSCGIVIPDANVSRQHAEIRRNGDGFEIVDLGSTNGIEVNGRQMGRHELADGDDLLLGATHVRVALG